MRTVNPFIKTVLMSTAGIASIAISGTAMAQDTASAEDAAEEEVVDDNVIIVTASKRETTLQELPVAVSVTSAETIEDAAIRDLGDLQTVVPSLRVNQLQSSANTNFIIRGFGNGANNPGIEPSVGVFIDGVYRSRSAAQIGDLPNVQRIEVLRGPQSTLFGKNASAGVISVVTQEPQFTFGGSAELSYGNYEAVVGKLSVTGPITDTVAFSLAGNLNKRDGYARDLNLGIDVNERDRYGFRGQLLFEPSNDFKVRLIADYDKIDENCCVAGNLQGGPTDPIVNALAGGQGFVPQDLFSYTARNNFPSSNDIENYGISGQIDYEFGALTLTSITALRGVRIETNQDSDFTSADLIGENRADTAIDTFTQELRIASDFDGPINFLLGGYYFTEDIDFSNQLFFGADTRAFIDAQIQGASGGALNAAILEGALGASDSFATMSLVDYTGIIGQQGRGVIESFDYANDAYSIFGQVDFEVTDRLTLTAGFNYTDDSKKVVSDVQVTDIFSTLDLNAPQYAPFRNQLLFGGALAQGVGNVLMLGRPATQQEIGMFAAENMAAFGQISAGAQAFADANDNNPAANPLAGLSAVQFLPPFVNFPNSVESGRTDDQDLSYTLRAGYELTDSLNVYATYATGFKASSFNLSRDSSFLPGDRDALASAGLLVPNRRAGTRFAEPEEAEVYEIGLKGQFDSFAFNLAAFHQSLKGFQSNVFTGTAFVLANSGKTTVQGIEADASVTPLDGLSLTAALTYLDPEYKDFTNSAVGDLTGQRPAGISEISLNLGATYKHEFSNGSELRLHADYLHESEVQIADGLPGFIDFTQADPFAPARAAALPFTREVNLINGSITFALENGLEFSVWGRNLTNDKFITTIFDTPVQTGNISGYPNQPRTYGGTVRFKF